MRYPTVGDYVKKGRVIHVFVAKSENPDHEFLVALHEVVEAWLTQRRGISWKEVDKFDILFEKNRTPSSGEPGDDPGSPYFKEHQFATRIERMVCQELGISWDEYDSEIESF
jgi:hypothetical protein